jgi:hypothetical protein
MFKIVIVVLIYHRHEHVNQENIMFIMITFFWDATLYFGRSSTKHLRNFLPPSSGLKNKASDVKLYERW